MAITSIQYGTCPSITQEAYLVSFFGDTIFTQVTHDPDTVTRWISDIESIHRNRLHCLIVGLDVEWRPSFNRYQQNPVATLQLCVGRRCLIYQIIHSDDDIPDSLVDFLSNGDYTFVGVKIYSNLDKLETDYDEIKIVHNAVDLRRLVANRYRRRDLFRDWQGSESAWFPPIVLGLGFTSVMRYDIEYSIRTLLRVPLRGVAFFR
ncbi:UNVERIFIED_CONTAM: hypothetical protein Scaly_0627200 [Sesamum calycinum]|uniref:3'-5' exonuclease domain-containing protein n=1 Tax=Sesamum calycinum TaxID=2727403 RepID=A0AAW2RTD8_9LAMI